MKALVINIGWEQERLVRVLAEYGVDIYAIHCNSAWNRDLPVTDVAEMDFRDLASILSYARKIQPDAVLADQCDYSYFAATFVSESLGLPGAKLADAQKTTNKWIQRESLKNSSIPQPGYRLCRFYDEALEAVRQLGYPVVIKPIDNRGSFGVNRVDGASGLIESYHAALANSHSRLVLVEEFIKGIHITIDGYNFREAGHRSLALASKTMIGGEKQVAMEIVYPGEIPQDHYQNATKINDEVVRGLGLSFGMTHAEYMIDETGRPYLIEIANRGGGVLTSSTTVPAVSGIDITRQLVIDSLGLKQELYSASVPDTQAVCLSFFRFDPGVLGDIDGLEQVQHDSQVLAFRLAAQPGDIVGPIESDGSRHGFVIVRGRSTAEVLATAQRVKGLIRPTYVN